MSARAVTGLMLSDEVQGCDSTNLLDDSTGLDRDGNGGGEMELKMPSFSSIDCILGLFCGICGGESSVAASHLLDGFPTSMSGVMLLLLFFTSEAFILLLYCLHTACTQDNRSREI